MENLGKSKITNLIILVDVNIDTDPGECQTNRSKLDTENVKNTPNGTHKCYENNFIAEKT